MTWTLEYSSKLQVIELVYTGRTTGLDLRESTSKAIALGKEQSSSMFLVDATEIELTVSTFDLYDLPTHQYPAMNLVPPKPCGSRSAKTIQRTRGRAVLRNCMHQPGMACEVVSGLC